MYKHYKGVMKDNRELRQFPEGMDQLFTKLFRHGYVEISGGESMPEWGVRWFFALYREPAKEDSRFRDYDGYRKVEKEEDIVEGKPEWPSPFTIYYKKIQAGDRKKTVALVEFNVDGGPFACFFVEEGGVAAVMDELAECYNDMWEAVVGFNSQDAIQVVDYVDGAGESEPYVGEHLNIFEILRARRDSSGVPVRKENGNANA